MTYRWRLLLTGSLFLTAFVFASQSQALAGAQPQAPNSQAAAHGAVLADGSPLSSQPPHLVGPVTSPPRMIAPSPEPVPAVAPAQRPIVRPNPVSSALSAFGLPKSSAGSVGNDDNADQGPTAPPAGWVPMSPPRN